MNGFPFILKYIGRVTVIITEATLLTTRIR